MKEIILFGAGGHAKVVADLVKCNNKEVKGFLCNDETVVEGLHFLGNDCAAESEYALSLIHIWKVRRISVGYP